jgi:Rrf2 family iron-sulfur cluster assembly transcriptional regulator
MIDLSQQDPDSYTPLKEIAARQEISEKYLENILKSLVTQGFILGLRGKGGGYRLTKSPEEYTLASILHATEGSLAAVACLEDHAPECARAGQCPTRPIWEKLNNLIEDYLGSITLADFHKTIIPCKIEK